MASKNTGQLKLSFNNQQKSKSNFQFNQSKQSVNLYLGQKSKSGQTGQQFSGQKDQKQSINLNLGQKSNQKSIGGQKNDKKTTGYDFGGQKTGFQFKTKQ